jgi:diguanylate cyclase (GGDEF)-like protein/PAS domain S-box-containing protein
MTPSNNKQLFNDIYENKQLTQLLSEFGFFIINHNDGRVSANTLFKRMGYTEGDITLDHEWTNNIHPEDKADVLVNRENTIKQESNDLFTTSYRFRKKNGEYVWLLQEGKYLSYDDSGEPSLFVGAEKEITQFKETERQLLQAKMKAEKLAQEAETLLKIGATISKSLKLNETAFAILKEIKNLVNFDLGVVFLKQENSLQAISALHTKENEELNSVVGKRIQLEDRKSFYSVIANYNKSLICNDLEENFPEFQHVYSKRKSQSIIGIPLSSKGKVIGVIKLAKFAKNAFTVDEYDTLSRFSNNIAVALENALLHEKISEMAFCDALTKINNRYGLQSKWEWIAQQSIRHKRTVSLMLIDIDLFKQVNDKFGHDAGDKALCLVAETIQDTVRSSDVVARFGGEEFVVVLPETPLKDAVLTAEKIRERVQNMQCLFANKGLTVSVGVHQAKTKEDMSLEEQIRLADEQLYLAKTAGRNCVFPQI